MAKINFFKADKEILKEKETWKILIADDEEDVHVLTKAVLKGFSYKNKALEFISTFSGIETVEVIKSRDDIALVLLDVIMETDDAGLNVVRKVRDELKNTKLQIILRTGQAADVPENDVVMNYAINDYKEKTELTSKKLYTTITTALRSYENILELKNTQNSIQNLNHSLEKLLASFDKSVIASRTDSEGKIIYVSKAFCKTFEYTKDELLGNTHDFLRHEDLDENILLELQKSYQNNTAWNGDIVYKTKSRKIFWANVDRFPEYDNNNEFIYFTTIFADITYQKEVESLNHELNGLLSSFDEHTIASKTDVKGNILYVSKAFCEVSGYKKKELLDQNHSILRHKDTTNEFYEELWETISSGNVWRGELHDVRKDGTSYWIYTIITPEYDIKGEFLCYTAISQNITPMKHIEEANRKIEILNTEIEQTQKEVVFRMGAIGESRSKETGMHVKRVAEYSKLFARYIGLSEKESEILKLASPMHDIGKVAIPDSILNKPGKLTEEEFEVMKTHAKLGYEMLFTSDREILKTAAIVAHEHQEKYNGTGYPRGLKGDEIHIYGRITSIADVFDALGSDRVYKKAWNDEKIFKLFKEEKGGHFDPLLVDIFFEHLDEFLSIRNEFKDD